jgi:phage terminase Nu1 subunit (DNA packaging protein)
MAQKSLSLRAYAQHRKQLGLPGGSLQAVQRAIDKDRISCVLDAGVKRIPDPDAADREWAANTDHTRSPGYVKDMADMTDEELEQLEGEEGGPSLSKASAIEKHWKAKSAELAYKERAGELVNAAEVATEYANFCTTVRTKLLGLPSRMKQAHPDLTLEQLATLDDYVREALEELAADSGQTGEVM